MITEAQLQAYLDNELDTTTYKMISLHLTRDIELRNRLRELQLESTFIAQSMREIQTEAQSVEAALLRIHESRQQALVSEAYEGPVLMGNDTKSDVYELGSMSIRSVLRSLQEWLLDWSKQSLFSMGSGAVCVVATIAVLLCIDFSPKQLGLLSKKLALKPSKRTLHRMTAKGGIQRHIAPKKAFLHMGIRDAEGRVSRIGNGDTLHAKQGLLFSMVLQERGFVVLLLELGKTVRVLYPFSGRFVHLEKGRHTIRNRGIPQAYHLQQHRGDIAFVLLHSASAIPPHVLYRLPMKQGRLDTAALRRISPTLSVDRVRIKVVHSTTRRRPE